MKNKEYGSDFPIITDKYYLLKDNEKNVFDEDQFSLFFSGRAALFNLLNNGIQSYNWNKVYIPSFYCHEVVHFIQLLPIEIKYYEFNPFVDSENKEFQFEDVQTTVIVNVQYFGIKKLNLNKYKNCIQIDDLTHSILEYKNSKADYCFGSLRKELPVPVGGFCYSPKNKPLPVGKVTPESEQISIQKITAMFLKGLYLKGDWESKNDYRKLYSDAESMFENNFTNGSLPKTANAILSQLDVKKIIDSKHKNIDRALSLLKANNFFNFNINHTKNNVFGLVIECKNALVQSKLKQNLVNKNIYPAVLWPNQIEDRDKEVEERILFVHLDCRNTEDDIDVIVTTINEF